MAQEKSHDHGHHEHRSTHAEDIQKAAQERELERLRELNDLSSQNRGVEKGATDLAPHENQTPAEEHRAGPLPNQKR